MALKSSTHETCSCVSPYAFEDLSSKQRQGIGVYVTFTYTELSVNIRIHILYESQGRNELISPLINAVEFYRTPLYGFTKVYLHSQYRDMWSRQLSNLACVQASG